jgi:outer membrane protein assembly factor BamB
LSYFDCASDIRLKHIYKNDPNNWADYSSNPSRTNRINSKFELPLKPAWEFKGSAGISQYQPIIVDSIIYIGFLNGELYALRMIDGKEIGHISLESSIIGNPVISRNMLYIPSSLGMNSLKSYDLVDGRFNWKKKIGGIESSILLIGNNIYAATLSGEVHCINKSNGETKWQYNVQDNIHSSPSIDSNLIVFGSDDGFLYALDITDGKFIWKFYTSGPIFSTPSIFQKNIYFGSDDGKFYSLSSKSGSLEWKFSAEAPIKSAAAIDDSCVFFGALNGKMYSLNRSNGKINWSFSANSIINTSPVICGDYLFLSSLDKKLYILDKVTGKKIWEYEVDGRIKSSPIIWKDYLLFCYEDSYIIAFKTQK